MFKIEQIKQWLGDELVESRGTFSGLETISSISTDTRAISPGSLFVALRGEVYDGHAFTEEAFFRGAIVSIVDQRSFDTFAVEEKDQGKGREESGNFLVVRDTLNALQALARGYRNTLEIPVVAITGSNGKTTTKNFTAAVLAKRFKVRSTVGNLNNHIGLPLSVLSILPEDQIAVFEIGMNHPGEIRPLAELCKPNAAIITNIGVAHIEFFNSKEGIAREKGEVGSVLPSAEGNPSGLLVIPADEEFAPILESMTKAKVEQISEDAPESMSLIEKLKSAKASFLTARHILMDSLLAAAIGRHYCISEDDIADALISASLEKGRFDIRTIETSAGDITVIDDTYNANPDSVCASIGAFAKTFPDQQKIVALGCLKEQGEHLIEGYKRIIQKASESGISKMILVNIPELKEFKGNMNLSEINEAQIELMYVASHEECAKTVLNLYEQNSKMVFLFKGSRGARMEEAIRILLK